MESRCFKVEGVPEGGILVGDIKDDVPESLICKYFGPRTSKSGWKYNAKTTLEEQDAILSLYRRVYESREMPNKELTLQFARSLISMSLGKKVDWCQFRDERRKFREALRKKRGSSCVDRSEKEGEGAVCPSTIGRKRFSALVTEEPDREGMVDFPSELKPSVKREFVDVVGGTTMGKKVVGKGRSTLNSPSWLKKDIEVMARVIEERSELVKSCKDSLAKSVLQSKGLEEKLRRAKLMKSDREANYDHR